MANEVDYVSDNSDEENYHDTDQNMKFNWIVREIGLDNLLQVLRQICYVSDNFDDLKVTSEVDSAKEILLFCHENKSAALSFLKVLATSFEKCYLKVQTIKVAKTRQIMLEKHFAATKSDQSLLQAWTTLAMGRSMLNLNEKQVILHHILQHFWSCSLLYKFNDIAHDRASTLSDWGQEQFVPDVGSEDFSTIRQHAGWVCKRVRDQISSVSDSKIQDSKANATEHKVPKSYLMSLIESIGQDKLIEKGKFLFIPSENVVPFFIHLHAEVENLLKSELGKSCEKDVVKKCLERLAEDQKLRDKWKSVLVNDGCDIFNAASIIILQRIVTMFVKSKQQIFREQMNLKPQRQSSLRQGLKQTVKKTTTSRKKPKEDIPGCIKILRSNFHNPSSVVEFLETVFSTDINILQQLHGKELCSILKSLNLPCLSGKSKQRQIDVLAQHHAEGRNWDIVCPNKVGFIPSVLLINS